ncbi:hypothetical protein PPERSA_11576 [Pseudocohnilembus persalinus]|uniref:Copper transporter n=1 Tax=Pseudocohnilembus persalinus TaxID=266149 RepID=A0A0V0QA06_PSEPJ|nr:hypothetical protein PPERSA_11576 [Pseudocohnilembus persalinus]|eukprot:KRW98975.1 hypothetical protein PPERSA_11576 [Pseudocohnilembus persalinus]
MESMQHHNPETQSMHMGHMYMVLWFDCDCKFIFQELKTNNQCGWFVLGCILTFIYCFLHIALQNGKSYIVKNYKAKNSNPAAISTISDDSDESYPMGVKIQLTIWYFFFALSNVIIMLLMMTMNGYVEIVMALGLTCGYIVFNVIINKELKQSVKTCS